MIRITRRNATAVTVEGHACSDVYGKDLICAAVSALVLTLEANMERMHRKGQLYSVRVHLEPGKARIRCVPRKEYQAAAAAVFDNICTGFRLLSGKYPEFVDYWEV